MDINKIKTVANNLANEYKKVAAATKEYDKFALKKIKPFSEREKDLIMAISVEYWRYKVGEKSKECAKDIIESLIREYSRNE